MKINIENYEIYLIDYTDGLLSKAEMLEVEAFLNKYPHIKNEFEGIQNSVLTAEFIPYENKKNLKATISNIEGVSDFDYLAIKQTEEPLTEHEKQKLKEIVYENPTKLDDLSLYKRVKLKSDPAIVFTAKKQLQRFKLVPTFSNWQKQFIGAVAAAVAIICIIVTFHYRKNEPNLVIAKQSTFKQKTATSRHETTTISKITEPSQSLINKNPKTKPVNTNYKASYPKRDVAKPLSPKNSNTLLKNTTINAYEKGLNVMIPQYINNQIALRTYAENTPKNKDRSQNNWMLKIIERSSQIANLIKEDQVNFKKQYNEQGELVAYHLKSNKIELSKKIRK